MALVIADRVRETTTTTGTGAVTLAGPYTSFQAFSAAVGNGNSTYYTIASAASGEWEVGIGTYSSSGNTLSRTTVLSSSNAGSLVNFSAGAKDVFVTQPSERSLLVQSAGSGLFSSVAAFTANGVPYADSTSTLATSSSLTFDGTTLTAPNITSGGSWIFSGGTANGVLYLNGSKVATSGSALTFASSTLTVNNTVSASNGTNIINVDSANQQIASFISGVGYGTLNLNGSPLVFQITGSEQMRLTSTGLGIGTSSPGAKLDVQGSGGSFNSSIYVHDSAADMGISVYSANNSGTPSFRLLNGLNSARIWLSGDATGNLNFGGPWNTTTALMTLTGSGNLGIGVTNPSVGLVVAFGTDGIIGNYYSSSGANSRISFSNTSLLNNNVSIGSSSDALVMYTGGSERARIDSSGNFGIGTTSPGQKLHVDNSANSSTWIKVSNGSAGSGAAAGVLFGNDGGDLGAISLLSSGNSPASALFLRSLSTNPLVFGTNNTERARIDSSGNLVLGATFAVAKLDVRGKGYFETSTNPTNGAVLTLTNQTTTSNNGAKLVLDAYNIGTVAIGVPTNDSAIAFYSGPTTERARIDSSGRFGIGTTSPSAELHVSNASGNYGLGSDNTGMALVESTYGSTGSNSNASFVAKNLFGYSQFMQWENYGVRIGSRGTANGGAGDVVFTYGNDSEGMRLTSTGLGIGTSSPSAKLSLNTSGSVTTFAFDVAGYGATSGVKQRIGGFADSLYLTSNYYYNGSQNADNVLVGQSSITVGSGTIGFSTSAAGSTSPSLRMTLDSSGNLGLGVTPSAWVGPALQTVNNASFIGYSNSTYIGQNWLYTSGAISKYLANGYAQVYEQNKGTGSHIWYTAPSGTAGNAISFTQAMTLDASGNLGVGTTSPTYRMEVVGPSGDNIISLFRSGDATAANNAGGGFRSISSATAASRMTQLWLDADGANLSGGDYFYIQKNGNSGTADIVQYSNSAMTFATNATERARIDSSGNLLVGTSSALFSSTTDVITASRNQSASTDIVISNQTLNAASYARLRLEAYGGGWQLAVPASGTYTNPLTFSFGSSEKARFDSGGNFSIGGTTAQAKLNVITGLSGTYGSAAVWITDNATTSMLLNNTSSGVSSIWASGALTFGAGGNNNTEAARIDSSGNFAINSSVTGGNTSGWVFLRNWFGAGDDALIIGHPTGTASGSPYMAFNYNGTGIGTITQNGTAGVLYNITSDYRLKNVIGAVSDAGARIDALEPIEYEWKADGVRTRGFLAHKFQEVYPHSVAGEKDAVDAEGKPIYQQMQASTTEVIADLVAEIQSLRARVAQLEAKGA